MNDRLKDFTRGGQTWMHAMRMLWQSIRYILFFTVLLSAFIFACTLYKKTQPYNWYISYQIVMAKMKIGFHGDKARQKVKSLHGNMLDIQAKDFVSRPSVKRNWDICVSAITEGFVWSLLASIGLLLAFVLLFSKRGRHHKGIKKIRGAKICDAKTLKKKLEKENLASHITLAGVPIAKDSETQHILIAGTTGTGKSVAISELMDAARAKKQKAVVFDVDGSYVSRYFREGKDKLINPFDKRGECWDLFRDCEDSADYEAFAESLMPLHLSGSDPFWIQASRTIFSASAFKLSQQPDHNMKALLAALFSESLGNIAELVKNTVAEPMVSEKLEKTALSIKATLSTYCKSLLYLPEVTKKKRFSIREWVQDDEDSWLFIAAVEKNLPAVKSIYSALLDLASREIRSLPPCLSRRVWFFVDELHTLNQLPSLMATLSKARKFGGCFVAGLQDIHMLHDVYGQKPAESLLSLFNTFLCLKNPNPNSASWASRAFGSQEILENKEGISYGANEIRDGVTINQERRKEPLVMGSEISFLDDLHGFLKLSGNFPIAPVVLEIKDRAIIAKTIIRREMQDISLVQKSFAKDTPTTKEKKGPQKEQKAIEFSSEKVNSEWGKISEKEHGKPLKSKKYKTDEKESFSISDFDECVLPEKQNTLFHAATAATNLFSGEPTEFNLVRRSGKLRKKVVDFLKKHKFEDALEGAAKSSQFKSVAEYLQSLSEDFPGDEFSVKMLAHLIPANIFLYTKGGSLPKEYLSGNPCSLGVVLLKNGIVYSLLIRKESARVKQKMDSKTLSFEPVKEAEVSR